MTYEKAIRVSASSAVCGFAVLALSLPIQGCAAKKPAPAPQPTAQERQDRAMKDPFGYKPDWTNTSVGGDGTADLDQDGLRKDLHNVFIR